MSYWWLLNKIHFRKTKLLNLKIQYERAVLNQVIYITVTKNEGWCLFYDVNVIHITDVILNANI